MPLAGETRPLSWEIDGAHVRHCIIASIPALTPRDPSLPPSVEDCYRRGRRVVFATLARARLDEVGYVQLLGSLTGRNTAGDLETGLGPELYGRFLAQVSALGLTPEQFDGFRPWFAAHMAWAFISIGTPARADLGVERQLYRRSWMDRKEVLGLESDQAHAELFARMPDAAGRDHMGVVLDGLGPAAQFQRRISTWRRADLVELEAELKRLRDRYPAFHEAVFLNRHRSWRPQLLELMNQDQPHVIVLDILHLVGPDGILKMLEDAGRSPRVLSPWRKPAAAQPSGRSSR